MKWCGTCQQNKELNQFNKNKLKKDGLNTICRQCSNKKAKEFYHSNKEHHLKNIYKNRKKYNDEINSYISTCKQIGCKYCNEKELCCLDFHHIDKTEKSFNIGGANKRYSLKTIRNEIKKCIVICANCHRKLHAGLI